FIWWVLTSVQTRPNGFDTKDERVKLFARLLRQVRGDVTPFLKCRAFCRFAAYLALHGFVSKVVQIRKKHQTTKRTGHPRRSNPLTPLGFNLSCVSALPIEDSVREDIVVDLVSRHSCLIGSGYRAQDSHIGKLMQDQPHPFFGPVNETRKIAGGVG